MKIWKEATTFFYLSALIDLNECALNLEVHEKETY